MPSGLQGRRDVGLLEGVEGLYDMLAAALRGSTRATLGLPGDLGKRDAPVAAHPIIGGLDMLLRGSQFPTTDEWDKKLPKLKPQGGDQFESVQKLGEFLPFPAIAPGAAGAVGRTAKELTTPAMAAKLLRAAPAAAPMEIIRPPGGNFLTSALPKAPVDEMYSDVVQKALDTKLPKYLRDTFGAANDPLRPIWDSEHGGGGMSLDRDIGIRNDRPDSNWEARNQRNEYANVPGHWAKQHNYYGSNKEPNTWDMFTGENLGYLEKPEDVRLTVEALRKYADPKQRANIFNPDNEAVDRAVLRMTGYDAEDIAGLERMADFASPDKPVVFPAKGEGATGIAQIRKSMGDYMQAATNMDQVEATNPALAEFMRNNKLTLTPKDIEQGSLTALFIKSKAFNAWMDSPENVESAIRKAVEPITDAPGWFKYNPDSPDLKRGLKIEGDIQSHCIGGMCEEVKKGENAVYSLRRGNQPHIAFDLKSGPWGGEIEQVFRAANQLPMEHDLPHLQSLLDHLRSGRQLSNDPKFKWQHDARTVQKELIRRKEELERQIAADNAELDAQQPAADAAWEAAAPVRRARWAQEHPNEPLPEGW